MIASASARWASTALPDKRLLYCLSASLSGFRLEAVVFGTGTKGYGIAVLVDGVHTPGSPLSGFATLPQALQAAKDGFSTWTNTLLQRV